MATYWENSCSFGLRYVSWYKCLIVSLVFSHLGFWSGNLFLIAPFPDLCLLVPFEPNTILLIPKLLKVIADVFIDSLVALDYVFGTFNVINVNYKTNARSPNSTVHVTSLLLEKHVVSSLGSINIV